MTTMATASNKKDIVSLIVIGLTITFLSLQVIRLGREEINRIKHRL